MSAKKKKKKAAPKSRWNLIHERWELKTDAGWEPHPQRSRSLKWLRIADFIAAWKHEVEKEPGKSSIANLAKKFRVPSSEIKKQRTTINNSILEHFPDQPHHQLRDLPDHTDQQRSTYRSQSNELTKDNLAELLGITLYKTS